MARVHVVTKGNSIVGGILLLVFGIGALVGGSFFKKSYDNKSASWPHVVAVVSDYDWHYSSSSEDMMYSEILQYEVNGRIYESTSNISTNFRPTLNVKKEIAYNPDNPYEFVFTEGSDRNMPTIILFAVGGIFTAVGALLLISGIVSKVKSKRKPVGNEQLPESVYGMSGTGDNIYRENDPFDAGRFDD